MQMNKTLATDFYLRCWLWQRSLSDAESSVVRLSVRPSINLFTNRIGSLSFHPIFPIFSLNVHNNIAQKAVEVEFWFFAAYFSMYLKLQK